PPAAHLFGKPLSSPWFGRGVYTTRSRRYHYRSGALPTRTTRNVPSQRTLRRSDPSAGCLLAHLASGTAAEAGAVGTAGDSRAAAAVGRERTRGSAGHNGLLPRPRFRAAPHR